MPFNLSTKYIHKEHRLTFLSVKISTKSQYVNVKYSNWKMFGGFVECPCIHNIFLIYIYFLIKYFQVI